MPSKANVYAGRPKVTGVIYRGPKGQNLPTDATAVINASFKELGYVSEDGITRTIESSYETRKAMGGDEILRERDELAVKFEFTLVEYLHPEARTAKYGSQSAGNKLSYRGDEPDDASWVIETEHKGKAVRIVIPDASDRAESQELTIDGKTEWGMKIELTCARDSSGVFFYEYLKG